MLRRSVETWEAGMTSFLQADETAVAYNMWILRLVLRVDVSMQKNVAFMDI
jgi:hypothetical protein